MLEYCSAGVLEYCSAGVLECWSAGVLECCSAAVLQCCSAAVLECCSAGVLECCSAGVLECWSAGVLEYCSAGVLECWSAAVLQCWSAGVLECWSAGALIGLRSAKVLRYTSRVKTCIICDAAARAKKDLPPHDCRRNWDKSSKAMEPDVAVQLVKELPTSNFQLGALIADDDAVTIKRVREEVDVNIEKWADLSHTRKNFGSKIGSMMGTHKELKNDKTQAQLTKCFMYAIKTNKNNPEKVSEDLMNVPNHVFGRHSDCGDWCKAKSLEDPSTYIFAQLPQGKPLQSDALHNYLTSLFSTYAANASKLAPCGSSN